MSTDEHSAYKLCGGCHCLKHCARLLRRCLLIIIPHGWESVQANVIAQDDRKSSPKFGADDIRIDTRFGLAAEKRLAIGIPCFELTNHCDCNNRKCRCETIFSPPRYLHPGVKISLRYFHPPTIFSPPHYK